MFGWHWFKRRRPVRWPDGHLPHGRGWDQQTSCPGCGTRPTRMLVGGYLAPGAAGRLRAEGFSVSGRGTRLGDRHCFHCGKRFRAPGDPEIQEGKQWDLHLDGSPATRVTITFVGQHQVSVTIDEAPGSEAVIALLDEQLRLARGEGHEAFREALEQRLSLVSRAGRVIHPLRLELADRRAGYDAKHLAPRDEKGRLTGGFAYSEAAFLAGGPTSPT